MAASASFRPVVSPSRALVVRKSRPAFLDRWRTPAILAWIIIIFALGGGSRGNILSLAALRPMAAVVAAIALIGMTADQWRHIRWPAYLLAALAALTAVQLVPGLGGALPGRDLLRTVTETIGIDAVLTISQSPTRTWNALYALIVPASALFAYARLSPADRPRLLALLLGLIVVTVMLAVMQLAGPRQGPLYLYDVTNVGGAVGLFANRNHQAMLLALTFPIGAAYLVAKARHKQQTAARRLMVGALLMLVVPLLLATGSRGGLLLAGIGFLTMFLFMPAASYPARDWRGRKVDPRLLLAGIGGIGAPLIAIVSSRIATIERLVDTSDEGELRTALWAPVGRMIADNWIAGGGMGTFADVYKRYEPDALLNFFYVNHVHNDWLELAYEAGVAGVVLMGVTVGLTIMAMVQAWRQRSQTDTAAVLQRLAVVAIVILGIASLFDYPLRVPSMASLAVILMAWATGLPGKARR